ncbi:branched-chain amino acid ABC transporter permease [Roseinatronobacter alkalisoli]|uniref:Branched-chain amino acid ABC transporter permease n=1 Tax=Roseinatronobacter alkalisoli TaxID=3028235 RepID=A0ABT5T7D5_9RHOB|nr:branched-chain amino acid ABC transporter permease [Roseinatronobacter sp. HJB301]MDD7970959.1 branched-chain amino acid ABC transporter permease [Roseinatronobacter sp. HJB301]
MLESLIQGILLGGYYAVLAAGLSLMFGVVRFINLAHGDMAVLGAMGALWLVQTMGFGVPAAIALTLPAMAALGWLMQRLIFERALAGGFLIPILTTIGLAAALQNGMFAVFGSDTKSLGAHIGALSWSSWQLPGNIFIGKLPVYMFVTAIVVLGVLHLLLTRTPFGRAVRATSTDAEAAALCGVDARRVHRWAAAIAVALAGLAGIFLALRAQVTPFSGPMMLIFAFEAVVIGGIGSLRGTLIGGIALGVAQTFGGMISPQFSILAGHCLFLGVLAFRLMRVAANDRGGWRSAIVAVFLHRDRLRRKA